jgi:xanthine dehydrogenase accessory factor
MEPQRSAYFDLKLPCGSGLDLYFDPALDDATLASIADAKNRRAAFWLETDLKSGAHAVEPASPRTKLLSEMSGDVFRRAVVPMPRVLVVGGGPSLAAVARLFAAAGLELQIATPDDAARREIAAPGLEVQPLAAAASFDASFLDAYSAAVVAFHEHEWEVPVLAKILQTDCFFIGVMGSKAAHANRVAGLTALGVSEVLLQRLRSPVGLIPGAKSRGTLAVGILADVIAAAKKAGLLA